MSDPVQMLVEHVTRGDIWDLSGSERSDEVAMRSWGEERSVPATVVRDILRGRLAADPDPHGLRLRGARITGRLDLENLTTTVALELYDCWLTEGLVARDAELPCLVLAGCLIEHPDEPPFDAQGLTASVVSLFHATVTGAAAQGVVQLAGARIGGQLICTGAKLHNSVGVALHAERVQVGQSMYLRDGFVATGSSKEGAVRLLNAEIGGELSCSGAKMINDAGPAFRGDGLHVGQSLLLRNGFEAVGAGELGAVRLTRANVDGYLDCSGAKLRNGTGPALSAAYLTVSQSLILRSGFEALGDGPKAAIILTRTQVGGLFFGPDRLVHPDPAHRLEVNGLEYTGLPTSDWRTWLGLLRDATPAYAARPYQHLASTLRAAGDDKAVRAVLIEQRRDQLRRATTSRSERSWGRFTGVTLGYGYQPWRALVGLLAVALVAVLLCAAGPGAHEGLARTGAAADSASSGAAAPPCTIVDRVGVGLDLGLPLIKTGSRSRCDATDTATGQTLTILGWGLQALAWAFTTLFVAGFTGAVRKT